MAKIGGFDPNLGIQGLSDGRAEIGRANLPGPARLLPESSVERTLGLIYGRLSDSALLERFKPYLALDLQHRELLSPDVFFDALERAAASFARESEGRPGEGPMAGVARALQEVLADRQLCEMLRSLVLKV